LKRAGQIPVERNTLQASVSLTTAQNALAKGKTVVIFPEGELVSPGKRVRTRTGAVRVALQAGVPIIPLGIYVAPYNAFKLGFTRQGCKHSGLWQISFICHLNFGAPWKPSSNQFKSTHFHALAEGLMDNIYSLVAEAKRASLCVSRSSFDSISR
jgi:1-acyl-sn-glycerol-3-phosphate acyltransferase